MERRRADKRRRLSISSDPPRRKRPGETGLPAFSPLVARPGQQFTVLMLTHLLPAFFDYTAQLITSPPLDFGKRGILKITAAFVHRFLAP